MRKFYFTFGQVHRHEVNGTVFDKDSVCKIEAANAGEARKIMFAHFGPKWAWQYDELPDMSLFPRGIIPLIDTGSAKKESLVDRLKQAPEITAYLELYNEGHEMPYAETLTATPFVLFCRARNIVEQLSKTLPHGSWAVRIAKANDASPFLEWDFVTVNDSGVYDRFWNSIIDF